MNSGIIEDGMINICYALCDSDGHYSKFTAASIVSIFENTKSKVIVYILHDNSLSKESKNKFIQLAEMYYQHIRLINIDIFLHNKLSRVKNFNKSMYSIAAYYRLMLMDILPKNIKRCIYLDSDTIVNIDIAELYIEEISSGCLAAVPDSGIKFCKKELFKVCFDIGVELDHYFNSGVLLIDLCGYREYSSLCENGLRLLNNHADYLSPDQDVLNYFFIRNYTKLDDKYNILVRYDRIAENDIKNGIYHYIGNSLNLANEKDVYNQLFMQYYVKTPWFNLADFISGVKQMLYRKVENEFCISDILYGKKAIYCGIVIDGGNVSEVIKLLNVNSVECIPLSMSDKNTGVIDCINQMEKHTNDRLYVIDDIFFSLILESLKNFGLDNKVRYISVSQLRLSVEYENKIDKMFKKLCCN